MRLEIDTERRTLARDGYVCPLYSAEGFQSLSEMWLKVGWNQGHWRGHEWMGRPILQLADDVLRLASCVWRLRPDVIVETGVYQGGTTMLFASLCALAGHGRVIAIDVEITPGVRAALEHSRIELIQGDSADPALAAQVRARIRPGESVFVFLDSDHSRVHVAAELENYAPLVSPGSYLVVADTILPALADAPEGRPEWADDSPRSAVEGFLSSHDGFVPDPPAGPFGFLSYFAGGWLRCVRSIK